MSTCRAGSLPPAAHTINLAGEPLTRAVVDQLYAQPGVAQVLNLYGPTEATTYVTAAIWRATTRARRASAGPSPGRECSALDCGGQPVPIGVVGELMIGGTQVARGYLGRAAWTAAQFVPDPFSVVPGRRLYRTGDLARWRPDGQLEFLGRIWTSR